MHLLILFVFEVTRCNRVDENAEYNKAYDHISANFALRRIECRLEIDKR